MQKLHELLRMGDLAAFVGIVDDGGFAESARRRGVSASTLSRSVTRLEEQLKVTLLRRTTRSIEITPEGAAVLAEAREILDRSEALQEIATSGQAPAGPLRVNAPVPFVLHVLAPRLAEFRATYPGIQLSIDMTDTLVDLIGSHADVAIRFGRLPDSEMLHRPLGQTVWKLVATPEYLDRHGWPERPADLGRLEQVRFAMPDHINALRFAGHPDPVAVPTALTASNGEAVRQMVLGGLGIARFSDFMIAEDMRAGRLVELLPGQLEAEPLEISALYLTRVSGLRRLGVFLDWLATLMD
ncbi:LysR substrate-binding domain-containing protein [Marinovum sp. 2_MG-2023]|uniref:LysR family transcriptional regulator n=1 Tax=unclassified Marinovum TaxID=2647166 RepID=UPI0026E4429F|nr:MULTISPECIES: LysR family transcriptional regulator [unclassified Marinovum]MDO6729611.1 LysR substrate-binding domain-containing protein [Marinovum sp. 2_MG-2023]MDO6780235.1 LysR substrate-binding domain-containing protein [Marinovum sp. 1_MG-2023]